MDIKTKMIVFGSWIMTGPKEVVRDGKDPFSWRVPPSTLILLQFSLLPIL